MPRRLGESVAIALGVGCDRLLSFAPVRTVGKKGDDYAGASPVAQLAVCAGFRIGSLGWAD